MKNYKYSFLALAFVLSTASYSTAYEFKACPEDCPEKAKDYSCPEVCTKAHPKKSDGHEVEMPSNPFTLGTLVKAAVFSGVYYLYLEKAQGPVKEKFGDSAGEFPKLVGAVLFADELKSIVNDCKEYFWDIADRGWRNINPCCS